MITIFSTPVCLYCKKAKDFFKTNNLEFTEINVVETPETLKQFKELTGQLSVPVIQIGEDRVLGFDEMWIKRKLHMVPQDFGPSDPAEDNLCDSCQ